MAPKWSGAARLGPHEHIDQNGGTEQHRERERLRQDSEQKDWQKQTERSKAAGLRLSTSIAQVSAVLAENKTVMNLESKQLIAT